MAGRTDSGVHARGQVAHADVPADAWATHADAALRRLSRALPPDIRVRAIAPAPEGFDARFSALWRRYAYRICDDPATARTRCGAGTRCGIRAPLTWPP